MAYSVKELREFFCIYDKDSDAVRCLYEKQLDCWVAEHYKEIEGITFGCSSFKEVYDKLFEYVKKSEPNFKLSGENRVKGGDIMSNLYTVWNYDKGREGLKMLSEGKTDLMELLY